MLLCLCLPTLRPAAALPYDALYAFGDSLTDTGREPAPDIGYYMGRYSNGPLWVEYLSQRLGLAYSAANNHAESGAQTDDTFGQVTNFFPSLSITQSLCVVWAGGNINYISGHAIFEATHGTAPKYANQDKVNPGSVVLSGEMMFRYLGWTEVADRILQGLSGAIGSKRVTYDFARLMEGATEIKCSEFGDNIIAHM